MVLSRRNRNIIWAVFVALCPLTVSGSPSPYVGMESRQIKSLSASDIDALRRGAGWGLALPAELNGMPGPAHVLELKDQLEMSAQQVEQVQSLFNAMQAAAIPVGEQLIAAEQRIEALFASGAVDQESLRTLLKQAERARTELRFIHLSQHGKTKDLLSNAQVLRYNQLRGYSDDPCAKIPAGHNPAMYKKHMGCQ